MKDILISWVLPTTREEGGPLDVSEVQSVNIALSADGGTNFTLIGNFDNATLSVPVVDLPVGDQYVVAGAVTDTDGATGVTVSVPFIIADDSPPGPLAINVSFT